MNTSVFYLTVTIWGIAGSWALWQFGIKALMLDSFRDSLFETRDRLYVLARQRKIDCNSEVYRSIEQLINRLIRYAHRYTFLSYIISTTENEKAIARGENVDFGAIICKQIEAFPDAAVRDELYDIVIQIGRILPRYLAKSSLLFMALALVYLVVRTFQPILALRKKAQAVMVLEREAFMASMTDIYAGA
jgi:hypothetical protein